MRNLRNIQFSLLSSESAITSLCWDIEQDAVLYTHGPTSSSPEIELYRATTSPTGDIKSKLVASWAVEPVPDGPDGDSTVDSIVSIHHFGDVQTTCLVLSGGDIVLVREKDPSSGSGPQVHVPGAIDGGVTAASWSPDGELLVLTTRETELVLFLGRGGVFGDDRNGDGGPFTEVAMTADDLRLSRHVSVGWGKKETQFTGRGKKANVLRDPTIPEKVDSGSLSTADDGSVVTISWRGDGAYVAINSVVEVEAEQQQEQKLKGKRRVVRVYGRDGVLDSVSEPVDGLEAALSWRPAGNLIAGIQRKPGSDGENESVDVVFFERNGLRHGQFAVRVPPRLPSGDPAPGRVDSPVRLEWNCDSTVLAVILGESRVQLWTMGNYHWYLKQEVMLDSVPSSGSLFCWHPEDGSRLAASCSADSGQLLLAEYAFVTARGSVRPPNDYGAVAVIDGQTLKVTPFGKANIPPPMAMFELEAKTSIIDAAFDPDHSSLAVLHHGGLDLYAWQAMGSRAGTLALSKSLALDGDMTLPRGGRLLQVSFLARDELAVLVAGGDESLIHVRVDAGAGSIRRGREQLQPASPTILHNFVGPGGAYGLYGQDRVGCLYDVGSPELAPSDLRFPFQLPWCEIVAVDDKLIAFGLSRNGHLYANTRQLVRNCTSFLVTPAHLIFTTSNHLIKFVHLTDVESLEIPKDDPEVDERCRSIERGGRLVTAMPTNMSVVLQMPRGNLETIFPRAMVVAGIRQLIEKKNYKRAFQFCRTQRVDMNILYDHRPRQFLDNVGLFLEQIQDVTNIDLFLSSLKEEDVTQTMYKDTKPAIQTSAKRPDPVDGETGPAPPSKVNTICDAVLQVLKTQKKTHLQNLVTAHVCKIPPAIDDGLSLVAELMRENESMAEQAVEHICFLVDVNRLYDHALGLYNLELTVLIAQQAQRDPREYLPFIQQLQSLPELRRRFVIDDHLERYSKALAHLVSMPDAFSEVESYTKKHSLYTEATSLYRHDQPRQRILTRLYASYLESISKFRQAGLAFESLSVVDETSSTSAEDSASALRCYRSAGVGCWRECLSIAQRQSPPLSTAAIVELATTLADGLIEAKDHASAAAIYSDHLYFLLPHSSAVSAAQAVDGGGSEPYQELMTQEQALDLAIRCLCRATLFTAAQALCTSRPQQTVTTSHLLTTSLDPGLVEAQASCADFLADCRAQLRAQVPRIVELRRRAVEDPLAFYEGEVAMDLPDNVSVAASSRLSTSNSLFTRYGSGRGPASLAPTGMTGKFSMSSSRVAARQRRREEKKRARGRKGTVYEEEYLVGSVRRLLDRVNSATATSTSTSPSASASIGGGIPSGEVRRLIEALVRRGMRDRAVAIETLAVELVRECAAAVAEIWPAATAASKEQDQTTQDADNGGDTTGVQVEGNGELDGMLRARENQIPPLVPRFERLSLLGET